ncbi:Spy/CpxP family protein refolding chaperone [Curvibacter sp. APW13]|uniref:Spy/CpxP family protein refolding chaperone n=1 Tax=Curvibacter sp. APW13 TaxID=3077236 RepID=UPI0028DF629B|nr:Spy/CpxP family protein refolding chaperone [Curvibacter sp. APW13]MDT8990344.1 Spy/CpxP family protein refolding chaperone [Curvibacter sp. APW13]
MKQTLKTLVLVTALGTAALAAVAQPMMGGHEEGMGAGRMGQRDPAKMGAMMAKRADALKAQLKLTPEQEPAWNAWVSAMKPDAKSKPQRPNREELDKLSTPERIDKMRALRNEQHSAMMAEMDKRDQATKTFYASLNAEQKKVFDNQHMRMAGHERGQAGGAGKAPNTAKP